MSESAEPEGETIELAAQIERRHHQPDLCTIYQSNANEMGKMSRWITAKGDAFLDPVTVR